MVQENFDNIIRTLGLIAGTLDLERILSLLVEHSMENSHSDIAAAYLLDSDKNAVLYYKRGRSKLPEVISSNSSFIKFLIDCKQTIVSHDKFYHIFFDMFLIDSSKSALAFPIISSKDVFGFVILNSKEDNFYYKNRFNFLDSLGGAASGVVSSSHMHKQIVQYLKEIETLHIYQKNIFTSMTNMLITVDSNGSINYFNRAAKSKLNLTSKNQKNSFLDQFEKNLSTSAFKNIKKTFTSKKQLMGLEGILEIDGTEIDYSLNITPLKDSEDNFQGFTLIFTDQSAELKYKKEMIEVKEDRRQIKDMFSKYLSTEVVHHLTEHPNMIKPGGDKKNATIFFADIRGYTSFSEGRDPEYIIGILNDYFQEAVNAVIKSNGFIDKFIGDCIMAAWGVPMESEEEDARRAVSCAIDIQNMVSDKTRNFFKGEAADLKVGIGMHTGPLVAGNLGSSQRMDYSVIGDTVNVAARLEGVAGPGEIIITENTKKLLSSDFILEKRDSVKVKGKAKPLQIYNVKGKKKK